MTRGQLELPFLSAERVAAIDAALVAIQRSHGVALASRRHAEAAELERIGSKLVSILEDNAAAVRADPAHRSLLSVGTSGERAMDQAHPTRIEHPERTE